MKFLVVGLLYIYHGCSTWKIFWEEKFTGKKQDFFEPVSMRNCGKRNFRKHRDIKDSDELVTLKAYKNMYEILKISEKFDGNHIFGVKSKNGGIRKVVGNRSGSQDQSKFNKI